MKKNVIFQTIFSIWLGVFIMGSAVCLYSLNPALSIDQYNLEIYTTENGLPQSSVLSMVQSKDGYLWLGTYEGVARFDGVRFKIFDTANTPEMDSNRIKSLLEDREGNLWIGTSGGLLCYTGGRFKTYTTKNGLSNNFVVSLYEDRRGRLWIGTTNGLNCLEKGVITTYTREQGLSHYYISALVEDNDGNLCIGTSGGGLYLLAGGSGKITRCMVKGLPENADIRTLYKDKAHRIWVGTRGQGLALFPKGINGEFKIYTREDGLSGRDIRSVFQDSQGTLWIGTNGQGLNIFRNGSFSFSTSEQGFFSSPIRSIMEDREGSLWIGTRDGLSQLKEGKFIIYNKRNGLPVDSVRTVFQDNRENIWIGTVSGGLVRFKNGRFKTFGLRQGLKSEHIWTIAQSKDGSIWFGTYGGGLHRLKNGKIIKIYTTGNGLSNNVIRAVFVDRDDNVWVGTNGGGVDVLKLNQGKIINYNTEHGLSDGFVYAINGDEKGNTWIGTYYGKLNRFSRGKFTVYGIDEGLTGHAVWAIYMDKEDEGTVWIGTDGGGLLRFKDNRFTRFTVKDGLYSDLAFGVFEDSRGNLWMNCNQGIYSVGKNELEDFAAGKINKIPYLSFGKTEGIKNTECNGPAQPAGICTKGGELWFPTIRGAVVINPQDIKLNKTVPPVVIEEMQANGERVFSYPTPEKQRVILAPGKKRVEFKYTGLSFHASERMKFKYKLEGFDDQWIEAGIHRRVSYTNIEPGNYTFRVIACNNDGVWNNRGAELSFTLEAFFWQTWWFQVLFLAAFAFFSYTAIGFVKKHLKLVAFWKKKKYIGTYELEEQIGIGGMGVIYKAHSLMDKSKIFAVKVMKEEYLVDEVQKKRFKNESLLVDRLDHPNIVKVYERGEHEEKLYIVMELLEGRTLAERYKNDLYPAVPQVTHIMSQAAHILIDLHREGIIHRDLKPENIMLIEKNGDSDYVKLLDFGLARVQSFTHLTETGQVLGTVPYMPPEVLSDGIPSSAVDIYSLGVIGYEMLARQKPFSGNKPADTMRKILVQTPPEPIQLNPQVPLRLNKLILQMIDKDPLKRPGAREVLAILAGLQ